MQTIKVLGTGCANCKNTLELIKTAAEVKGIKINLIKVEEMSEIVGYGVMSTPAVVINDKVVHSGGIPDRTIINDWLSDNF